MTGKSGSPQTYEPQTKKHSHTASEKPPQKTRIPAIPRSSQPSLGAVCLARNVGNLSRRVANTLDARQSAREIRKVAACFIPKRLTHRIRIDKAPHFTMKMSLFPVSNVDYCYTGLFTGELHGFHHILCLLHTVPIFLQCCRAP